MSVPEWEQFQPYIRAIIVSALKEKKGALQSEFAMQNAQMAAMIGGMAAQAAEKLPSGAIEEAMAPVIAGGAGGHQQVHLAVIAAFDAAIAKLEGEP